MRTFAIADEQVAARLFLQHEREVLGPHGRFDAAIDVVGAHQFGGDANGKLGFRRTVDGRRIIAAEFEVDGAIEGLRHGARHFLHAPLDQVEHFHGERPHRAAQPDFVWHDIRGVAAVELRHGDHGGVDRPLVARDDALQRRHDLRAREHRVAAVVRHGRVRALAAHGDLEFVARCHQRAGRGAERADRHARPVVHAEHGIAREPVEQAVLDHLAGAAATFLRRLEDQMDGAIEIAMLGQVVRRAQQHRGVTVVAARVHLAFVLRAMAEGVRFLQRQGVHVGAQADGLGAIAIADDTDQTGGAQAAMDLDTPRFQISGHHVGGALFLETQFGMRMDVTADGADFGLRLQDFGDELHGAGPGEWGNWIPRSYDANRRSAKTRRRRHLHAAGIHLRCSDGLRPVARDDPACPSWRGAACADPLGRVGFPAWRTPCTAGTVHA